MDDLIICKFAQEKIIILGLSMANLTYQTDYNGEICEDISKSVSG